MPRLQGLEKDVTHPVAVGLGSAGRAMQGFMGAKLTGTRLRQEDEELARDKEQRQQQRVLYGLAVKKLGLELKRQEQRNNLEAKGRRDEQEANALGFQALAAANKIDALGPKVGAFWQSAVEKAAGMEPEAGRRVLMGAAAMINDAEQQNFRDTTQERVHNSVATGYWQQIAAELAQLGGTEVDITGDGEADVSVASLPQIGEGLLAAFADPNADIGQVAKDFEVATRVLEEQRVKLRRRVERYTQVAALIDQRKMSSDPNHIQTGPLAPPLPMALEQEAWGMLEQYRRGELGDGEMTENELLSSVQALMAGRRRVPLPPGHPLGSAVEVDAASSGMLGPDGVYRALGFKGETPRERRQQRIKDARLAASDWLKNHKDATQEEAMQYAQRWDSLQYPDEPLDFGVKDKGGALGAQQQAVPKKKGGGAFSWDEFPEDKEWAQGQIVEQASAAIARGMPAGQALMAAFATMNIDPRTLPADVKAAILRGLNGQ